MLERNFTPHNLREIHTEGGEELGQDPYIQTAVWLGASDTPQVCEGEVPQVQVCEGEVPQVQVCKGAVPQVQVCEGAVPQVLHAPVDCVTVQ